MGGVICHVSCDIDYEITTTIHFKTRRIGLSPNKYNSYLSGELAGGLYTALGVSCLLHALPYNYLALCAVTVAHPSRKLTIKTNKVLFSSTTEPDNSLNIYAT